MSIRAAHSDVAVSVGPLVSFTCDLLAPTVSNTSKAGREKGKVQTKLSCPTCYAENGETSLVSQTYICQTNEGHGPFTRGKCAKAMATDDGEFRTVGSAEEVDAVRKEHDSEASVANFTAHPADDVMNATLAGEKCWIVRPKRDADPAFQVLLSLATESGRIELGDSQGDAVLVGEVVLSKVQRMIRVERWGEQLVFRELIRASDLKDGIAVNNVPPNPELAEVGRKFVSTFCVEFDAEDYADTTNARLREFGMSRVGNDFVIDLTDSAVPAAKQKKESTVEDLISAMQAVVEAAA